MPLPAPLPHVRRRAWQRAQRLRELGYDSYDSYLKSGHWHDLKRLYRESDRPQICQCGETDVELHHLTYERVGAEELTDLIALCRRCHEDIHVLERRGDIGLDMSGLESPDRAAEYAAALKPLRDKALRENTAPVELPAGWTASRRAFEVELVRWIQDLCTTHEIDLAEFAGDIKGDIRAIRRGFNAIEHRMRKQPRSDPLTSMRAPR